MDPMIDIARLDYERAGLDTIPFAGKRAIAKGWPSLPPEILWSHVHGRNLNIGLRCGGAAGLANTDADAPDTTQNLQDYFAGLGVAPVVVKSVTPGHQHFLVTTTIPPEFARCNAFDFRDVGKGQLKFGCGSAFVAPPSAVKGAVYAFEDSTITPATIGAHLQHVDWKDLAVLANAAPKGNDVAALPVRLIHRHAPEKAIQILMALQDAHVKGQAVMSYPTRSQAALAATAMLILAGFTFEEIRALLLPLPVTSEDDKRSERNVARCYEHALTFLCNDPKRQEIAGIYHAAEMSAWPGHGGALEQAAILGVLSVAWACSSFEAPVSNRDLAQFAGATRIDVYRALARLKKSGKLQRVGTDPEHGTAIWSVAKVYHRQSNSLNMAFMVYVCNKGELALKIGRSATMIYDFLTDDPAQPSDIVSMTGKHKSTISRSLNKLLSFGLAEKVGAGWIRGKADLSKIAADLEVDKAAARRAEQFEDERRAWQEGRRKHRPNLVRVGRLRAAEVEDL